MWEMEGGKIVQMFKCDKTTFADPDFAASKYKKRRKPTRTLVKTADRTPVVTSAREQIRRKPGKSAGQPAPKAGKSVMALLIGEKI